MNLRYQNEADIETEVSSLCSCRRPKVRHRSEGALKSKNVIKTKKCVFELLCQIQLPVRQWILDNLIPGEEKSLTDKDVVILTDSENTLNRNDESWGSSENKIRKQEYNLYLKSGRVSWYLLVEIMRKVDFENLTPTRYIEGERDRE